MRADCRRIEEALAEGRSLNDTELEHLESCSDCRRLHDQLSRLDEDLPNLLPSVPEGLAERTIAAVEQAEPRRVGGRVFLARRVLVAAATFLLVGVVVINMRNAIQRGQQKRTMGDMRTIATSVESYSIDNNQYPANSAATVTSIQSYLEPTSIREIPTEDGWKTAFGYATDDRDLPEQQDGLVGSGQVGNRELGSTRSELEGLSSVEFANGAVQPGGRDEVELDAQFADKKRELQRLYAQSRLGDDSARRQQDAERARINKAERSRSAREKAERERRSQLSERMEAETSAAPAAKPAPARDPSSKELRSSEGPPAASAPAEATGDSFRPISGGFRAEYGEESKGIAEIVTKERAADEEGDFADMTFSTGSYIAVPAEDGRSSQEKAKALKSDLSAVGGTIEGVTDRLNDLDGQAVGSADAADVLNSLDENEARADALGESLRVGGKLTQDVPAKGQVAPASIALSHESTVGASHVPILTPGQHAANANDRLFIQMGYGALGYQPEDWKGVSLDRPVYFENTYLGGNARMAWLDRRAASLKLAGEAVAPHRVVGLPEQPFDAPDRGAVSLHVDASEAHVSAGEPRRVFLQVGIAGTEDAAWRRPPASVVVLPLVSDTREAEVSATIATLRAGLEGRDLLAFVPESGLPAFSTPAEAGTETVGVAPDEARKALRRLTQTFAGVEGGASLRTRRLVILADRPVGEDVRRLVHRLALDDVVTSVVSIGRQSEHGLETHAQIAQAGQGNLHLVDGADGVSRAVDDELDSLTRVVARALRLNIRPADGVRLIQVLGSRPLAKREVREVKAREKAVDRAVERTTGISSDRGADDPGLQTVLPYFLAGDRHVVIVELEVDGPGPLADVSLKMKDLVEMENRSLRASAALSRTPAERTPRQQQVRRNVAGFAVAKILRDAEVQLAAGGSARPDRLRALAAQLLADPLIGSEADARLLEIYARMLSEGSDRRALVASIECARLARLGRATP